ncbi:MAG: ABC transporter ATP-binding protein [Chitinophagaceae bacterium]|nr:ABC transporter ATP-binding protein [Chitinophagaceae bacterium]MCA6452699.1 ABC transporter ATP-binding protein [Chitinophagaceae bacterium]MCA6455204.1 ABC transporter ATP-binding protein [Chitinophagaceae bacterium]MCA6459590.1 ABC transporter ATP-binding protein [Chitinophagaceae bacterium]MCA6464457.1 ABC transporter ATP-binding protein [Chitinophagaceae bacterium]
MLKAEHITKRYGSLQVLKGVDIEVKTGEIVSIVGSSGAGKSTLLHILGTLDRADEGHIWLDGQRVDLLQGKKLAAFRNRHIGFVFQFHHLLPEFTALENVSIPGWIAGRKKKEVAERAVELLTTLGLADRMGNRPQELSGGEQQRVAVARALINHPSIVFADEPTGNLDSIHAKELHELFVRLRDDFQQTFLIVTHNEELAGMSDRVLHMKDGRII